MDQDYTMDEKDDAKKALIPGITDNEKGLWKLLGLVLVGTILNQTSIVFERSMIEAYGIYFQGGTEQYEPEKIRSWWFILEFVSSVCGLFIITKIQPVFYYGIISVLVGVTHFVLAFVERDDLKDYAPLMGISGGIASGSVVAIPIYILWRNFRPNVKGIAFVAHFMLKGLFDILVYWVLRLIWWGGVKIPYGEDISKYGWLPNLIP